MAIVRDFDADHGDASCQVILSGPGVEIITHTSDARVASILAIAFARKLETEVRLSGDPTAIDRISVSLKPGRNVSELSYDVATARTTVRFQDGAYGWTDYSTTQSVVEAAIASGQDLQEVSIDAATHRLRRAKVNQEV